MDLIKVESGNLNRVGWEKENLLIEFKSKEKYLYQNVSREIFEKLLTSESKGKFFHSKIKGVFDWHKVEQSFKAEKVGKEWKITDVLGFEKVCIVPSKLSGTYLLTCI